MKKIFLFLICIAGSYSALGQLPCLPAPGGSGAADNPPGCKICAPFFQGNTFGFSPDSFDIFFPCDSLTDTHWLTLTADTSGQIVTILLVSNATDSRAGVNMGLYDQNLNLISNCVNSCGVIGFPPVLAVSNLVPGEDYWLMLDDCGFGSADYMLVLRQHFTPTDLPEAGHITAVPSYSFFCPRDEARYSIRSDPEATDYVWTVPVNSEILEGGGLQDTFVQLKYTAIGNGVIRVSPYADCYPGSLSEFSVFVEALFEEVEALICPGESYKVGNQIFDHPGIFEVLFENGSANGCDSTVTLDLKMPDTAAVSVNCVADTFLNVVSISWNRKPLSDGFRIFINDTLVSDQDFVGYIYRTRFPEEEIQIEIQPYGSHGCEYAPGKTTCKGPVIAEAVEKSNHSKISVLPNPSAGLFEVNSVKPVRKIEVFDFAGRKINAQNDLIINLSDHATGIYFLKIYSEGLTEVIKVLKN